MEFKVRQDDYNPLLKRKEVYVEVDHDEQGSPSRTELRKAIAAKYSTKLENVYVVDVRTKTGTQSAVCEIQVYDDPETAKRAVPKHIQYRNLPPEERKRVMEQEAKKEEAMPKAVKTKQEKPKEEKPKQEAKALSEATKKAKAGETK